MSATGERGAAMAAAKRGEFTSALRLAENIKDGWYRCQSLAAAARFAPEADVLRVAEKALKAARDAGDAYKRVAVSAWPVCALVERGKNEAAQKVLEALISRGPANYAAGQQRVRFGTGLAGGLVIARRAETAGFGRACIGLPRRQQLEIGPHFKPRPF